MTLQGKSFSITGALPVSREAFAAFIERNGGEFHPNPKRNTLYLIAADTGIYGYTGKMAKAMANGTQIIEPDTVCEWVGVSLDQIAANPIAYTYGSVDQEYRAQAAKSLNGEQRTIKKATAGLRESLQIYIDAHEKVRFAQPVRVMVEDSDEVARCIGIAVYRTASHRKEYVLCTTEGEAIYLDDVHPGCVADIYAAAVA